MPLGFCNRPDNIYDYIPMNPPPEPAYAKGELVTPQPWLYGRNSMKLLE